MTMDFVFDIFIHTPAFSLPLMSRRAYAYLQEVLLLNHQSTINISNAIHIPAIDFNFTVRSLTASAKILTRN